MRSTNENLLLWEQRINEKNISGMTIEEGLRVSRKTAHGYLKQLE